jgi:hypothetical protein
MIFEDVVVECLELSCLQLPNATAHSDQERAGRS